MSLTRSEAQRSTSSRSGGAAMEAELDLLMWEHRAESVGATGDL